MPCYFVRCLFNGAAGRVVVPALDFVADLVVLLVVGFDGVRLMFEPTAGLQCVA